MGQGVFARISVERLVLLAIVAAAVLAAVIWAIVNVPSWLAIYVIIWWTTLFAILPLGVRSQIESGDVLPGSEPGAPVLPAMGRKMLLTTVISAVVFGGYYFVYTRKLVSIDDLATLWGLLGN